MIKAAGRTLQDLIDSVPSLVDYFYNDTVSVHASNRDGLTPVPLEFSNWREEQRAWREAVLIFDQAHHMPEMFLSGPDATRLLNYLGINSFKNFAPLRAKQFICCNHNGQVIGECVLQHLEDGVYELISGMHLQNWVQYNAEVGGYDVKIVRDLHTALNSTGRTNFRYQLEGPFTEAVFAEVVEGEMPDIPFFRLARVRIAGCDVLALRHGGAGHGGVELSGPYADGPKVRAALMAAGEKHGIRPAGVKTYFSTLGEAGWIGYPTPAVYTDPKLADFRKWLSDDGWEASTQLAGSFYSQNIEDYYVTPWDLGVSHLLKFDHDFVGRAALEAMAAQTGHRKKVTLVWNNEDVTRIYASMFEPGPAFKAMELPKSSYGLMQGDEVRDTSGKIVGMSIFVGYTVNEAKFLSVAIVNADQAEPGAEVVVTWGEPNGGSRKPNVERHRQTTVRATVAPNPYAKYAQTMKNAALVKDHA
jgi:glycine cleavage system aminomethyltransferase T